MSRQRAAVTIRAVRSETATYLYLSAGRRFRRGLRLTLPDPDLVPEARKALDSCLIDVKDSLPGLEVTDSDAAEIYHRLRRTGMLLLFLIFQTAKNINAVQEFWADAVRFRDPRTPPLVQCVGDMKTVLPIEYLPLFAPRHQRRIANRAELIEACGDFAGFSAVVRRSFASLPLPQDARLRPGATGRLRVRFLRHDSLDGAARELKWFTETAHDHVEVAGPFPSGDESEPELRHLICDPRPQDQIQHFACHCYTRADDSLSNEIVLSGDGRTVVARLDDLGAHLADRHYTRGRPARMPLVVMNACGASRMAATSALSFPALFLGNENRGFIGSDIEVPDDVAAAFSEAFYTSFILRRRPLGEAVHHARHHLLTRFGNPLGLGYSAYADPDLHIEPREGS